MKKSYIICSIVFVAVLLSVIQIDHLLKEDRYTASIAEKIIRFHVRANSNSDIDQELKLKVRNAVGTYLGPILAEAESSARSKEMIENNLSAIINTAQKVIKEEGFTYNVSASLRKVSFPVKTYGSFTFPAGEYEALQVVIGTGAGRNWWCVMYPNLCFSDSTYEVVDQKSERELERVLTAKEYSQLMKNKNYNIKFKWLSFLN